MTPLSHSSRLEGCIAMCAILCLRLMPSVVCQGNNFFDAFDELSSGFNTPDTNTPDSTTPDSNATGFNFGKLDLGAQSSEPEGQGTPIVVMMLNVCFALERGVHHRTAAVAFDDKLHQLRTRASISPPLTLVERLLTPFAQGVYYKALFDLTVHEEFHKTVIIQ